MNCYKGMDVSEYQGSIDWNKAKADGIEFAMLRCGYGRFPGQKDTRFEEYYQNATKAGIAVGTYLFSYAVTKEQAKEEAENCLVYLKGKKFGYPIAYDVETASQGKLSKARLSEVVDAFCKVLEENGYYVCIYANLDFLRNHLTEEVRQKYDIWLAQWGSMATYEGQFGLWQYTANGKVQGIRGAVDLDFSDKNYPEIMRERSLNGYSGALPETIPTKLYPGKEIYLQEAKIYSSAITRFSSGRITGRFYLYDNAPICGRIRITDRSKKVGKHPVWLHVTGWIDTKEILQN